MNPKFAKVSAEQACELRVRDTSRPRFPDGGLCGAGSVRYRGARLPGRHLSARRAEGPDASRPWRRDLSAKEQRFVAEYLKDYNGARAARASGD